MEALNITVTETLDSHDKVMDVLTRHNHNISEGQEVIIKDWNGRVKKFRKLGGSFIRLVNLDNCKH